MNVKRKFKNYFTKALLLCALTITATSCSKEETIPEVPVTLKKEKIMLGDSDYNSTNDPGVNGFDFINFEYNNNSFQIQTTLAEGTITLFPSYSFTRPWKPNVSILEEIDMEVQLVLITNNVEENIGDKVVVKTGIFGNNSSVTTNDIAMRDMVGQPKVKISKLVNGVLYLKYRYKDYKTNKWVENKKTTKGITTSLYVNNHFDNPFAATNSNTGKAYYRTTRKTTHSAPPIKGVSTNGWFPSSTVPMLSPGQSIYSPNGQYRMVIQSYDGVLLLLRVSDGKVLWSNKQTGGAYLFFYPDGNLIMLNNSNQMVWSSDIYRSVNEIAPGYIDLRTYLVFQDDGNLVMEWDGGNYTDVVGATGTGGGESVHYGSMKL